MEKEQNATGPSELALRQAFVGMLFALAIAEAAILLTDLLGVIAADWNYEFSLKRLLDSFLDHDWLLLAPATHLLLGILLISISWVGWSQSQASGNKERVTDIFSLPFFLLLWEVVLVVLYFILVKSVELDTSLGGHTDTDVTLAVRAPSATPEAFWLAVVFAAYVVWDIVADVIMGPIDKKHHPSIHPIAAKVCVFLTGIVTRCGVSILCFLAAIWVYYLVRESTAPQVAVWGDAALVCILLWFRPGKWLERQFFAEHFFEWEQHRPGIRTATGRPFFTMFWFWLPILSFGYFLIMIVRL